jgi:predicted O-methyltransferase YrrM
MSAIFILEALSKLGIPMHLTAIEAGKSQFSHSSEILQKRYGDRVRCKFGLTQDVLPQLLESLGPVDFLFHDAAHSMEAYVGDFRIVLPNLRQGAIALIEDIRWEDSRFSVGSPRCYEGWMQIVSHPRVRRAIEIDGSMRLALVGG